MWYSLRWSIQFTTNLRSYAWTDRDNHQITTVAIFKYWEHKNMVLILFRSKLFHISLLIHDLWPTWYFQFFSWWDNFFYIFHYGKYYLYIYKRVLHVIWYNLLRGISQTDDESVVTFVCAFIFVTTPPKSWLVTTLPIETLTLEVNKLLEVRLYISKAMNISYCLK
jgi:hypothetical protein